MYTIVCYGDSNTHGADPIELERWPRDVRWTGVLARELDGWAHVVEEGLNGRTTMWDDPYVEGRNGLPYLLPCLRSHAPVDLVVLMLGTNDLKTYLGRSAQEIALGVQALVDVVGASGTGPGGAAPGVLLLPPPALGPETERWELWGFSGTREKSEQLPRLYRAVSVNRGTAFLDAAALVAGDPADGIHLSAADHAVLATAVAASARELLG